MDNFQQLATQIKRHIFAVILLENAFQIAAAWAIDRYLHWPVMALIVTSSSLALVLSFLVMTISSRYVLQPVQAIWQAVVHLSPLEHGVPAPDVKKIKVGRELVANLTAQIYQLATVAEHAEEAASSHQTDLRAQFIVNNSPLPLFVLDPNQTITFANDAAAKYLGLSIEDIVNKNVYSVLNISFPSDHTFDSWLMQVKENSATATHFWERVRLNVSDNQPTRLFDMAAYYNKGNAQHFETLLTLFDHTSQYSQDEQAVSFIALSVHELRTPLTLLRGYIEAFEDEFRGKLSPELTDFMFKMQASAQQLAAFVNNILNVARVDEDQLVLELNESNWSDIVKAACNTMALRAKVRGITIEYDVAPDLPTVGVDSVSIHEVINNLIDNAIKYSGKSTKIRVSAHMNQEGMVETTVQDWGVGVPANVMPNLFTKFYRDHRNRAQIGGTGLGLFLSKAIVTAHGGNIWAKSHEGQGSTFGFTLVPYTKLAQELKNGDNKEIVRGAHGWIKNHSLYRG